MRPIGDRKDELDAHRRAHVGDVAEKAQLPEGAHELRLFDRGEFVLRVGSRVTWSFCWLYEAIVRSVAVHP